MKIFCIGRNYQDHAKELNNEVPSEPVIFMKPKTALVREDKNLVHPIHTIEWQYEAEIVLRICKNGIEVSQEEASKYYNEYTLGLDMTARDVQQRLKEKGLPWEIAKAHDGSAVVGSFQNIDANTDVNNINFSLLQNENRVQQGSTKDMIFDFDEIISYISQYFTLNIGDLVFTGTPAGVGEVNPGDNLQGFIEDREVLNVSVI